MKKLIALLLVKLKIARVKEVFYYCYEKPGYLMVTITEYPFSVSRLQIGNAFYIPDVWGSYSGICVDNSAISGYIGLKNGVLYFSCTTNEKHKFIIETWGEYCFYKDNKIPIYTFLLKEKEQIEGVIKKLTT